MTDKTAGLIMTEQIADAVGIARSTLTMWVREGHLVPAVRPNIQKRRIYYSRYNVLQAMLVKHLRAFDVPHAKIRTAMRKVHRLKLDKAAGTEPCWMLIDENGNPTVATNTEGYARVLAENVAMLSIDLVITMRRATELFEAARESNQEE